MSIWSWQNWVACCVAFVTSDHVKIWSFKVVFPAFIQTLVNLINVRISFGQILFSLKLYCSGIHHCMASTVSRHNSFFRKFLTICESFGYRADISPCYVSVSGLWAIAKLSISATPKVCDGYGQLRQKIVDNVSVNKTFETYVSEVWHVMVQRSITDVFFSSKINSIQVQLQQISELVCSYHNFHSSITVNSLKSS